MKANDYNIPDEVRSNKVEDLFNPCWIVKAQPSDSIDTSSEEEWMALVVFEDSKEMLEMIGEWGEPVRRKRQNESGAGSPVGSGI